MPKFIIYFLTIVLLLALNIVFPFVRQSTPNFLFLFVLFLAFQKDNNDFLLVAFFSGLFLDAVSAPVFGSYLISFLIIAMIVNYLTRTFFSADPNPIYMAVVVAVSNLLLVGLLYLINTFAFNFHATILPLSPVYLRGKIWLDLLLNLVFAFPVYLLTVWEEGIILKQQHKNEI